MSDSNHIIDYTLILLGQFVPTICRHGGRPLAISRNKVFLILLTLLTISISGYFLLNKYFHNQEKVQPKHGNVVESIYGLGTVNADKVFHVRTGLTLSVQKLFVSEGSLVQPGSPLVKLDESLLRSTIAGTVTSVSYKEGEIVPPQVAVVTVTNLSHLFLEVSLEQQLVLRVKKGQNVLVAFESLRNEKYEGVVSYVYPRDNQFIVRIELKKWPEGVLPGMTADVAIVVGKKTDVLLIPLRSLVAGQVTRIRNNKRERIPVKLGVIDGEWAEITSDNIVETDELIVRKQ